MELIVFKSLSLLLQQESKGVKNQMD